MYRGAWWATIHGVAELDRTKRHIHDEYYSTIKKNEIMPFAASWMCLDIIIFSEVSQRKTSITYHVIYEVSSNCTN